MNPAITVELQFFLISVLWGGILLLIYDILRILRRLVKHGTFLVAVQDLIFWVGASIFIFSMIYRENNGIIRGYSILGMMLGSILYHFAVSDFVVELITKLLKTLLQPFQAAVKHTVRLVKMLLSASRKKWNSLILRLKKRRISVKIKQEKAKREKAEKVEKQKLEKQRLEKQRLEKKKLEKRKLENRKADNKRAENKTIENRRPGASGNREAR